MLGQQTRYSYDAYGRLIQVSHWAGSPLTEQTNQRVTYYWDSNPLDSTYSQNTWGRLAAVGLNGPQAYMYSYNQAGRVTGQRMRYIRDVTNDFYASYSWDQEGKMTTQRYPGGGGADPNGGPLYQFQFDAMGRPSTMQDISNGTYFPPTVASASYGVSGELLNLSYNGYSETRTYNSLLQLTRMTVAGMMDMQYV